MSTIPAVWIGCLACYNNGDLVGRWVDCTNVEKIDVEDIHDDLPEWDGSCEELWCFDHEGLPVSGELGLFEAAAWGKAYEEVPEDQWDVFCRWYEEGLASPADSSGVPSYQEFEDVYWGSHDGYEELAQEYLDSTYGELPDVIKSHLDYESLGEEIANDYTVIGEKDGTIHLFR